MVKFLSAVLLSPCVLLAQTVTSSDSTVVSTLTTVSDSIPTSVSALAILIIGIISEVIMRIWPTKKPKSWFIFLSNVLKGIGNICAKLSALLDQVSQNLKPDQSEKK